MGSNPSHQASNIEGEKEPSLGGSNLPIGDCFRAKREAPVIAALREGLEELVERGALGRETSKNVWHHFQGYLRFIHERCKTGKIQAPDNLWCDSTRDKLAPDLEHAILNDPGPLINEFTKHILDSRGPKAVSVFCCSLRTAYRIFAAAGLLEFDAESIVNPAIKPKTLPVYPIIESYIKTCVTNAYLVAKKRFELKCFFTMVGSALGIRFDAQAEKDAFEAISEARPNGGKIRSHEPAITSFIVFQPERCVKIYIEALSKDLDCTKKRLSVALYEVRGFYKGLRACGYSDFDETTLKNPLNKIEKSTPKVITNSSSIPVAQAWLGESFPDRASAALNSTYFEDFVGYIAKSRNIRATPESEARAWNKLRNNSGVSEKKGVVQSSVQSITDYICRFPRESIQGFRESLLSNHRLDDQTRATKLASVRRFYYWAVKHELTQISDRSIRRFGELKTTDGMSSVEKPATREPREPAAAKAETAQEVNETMRVAGVLFNLTEYSPHPPQERRRYVKDPSLAQVIESRNKLLDHLLPEKYVDFRQATALTLEDLDVQKQAIRVRGPHGAIREKLLDREALSLISDYRESVKRTPVLSKTWKALGVTAPLILSADGGALVVDDMLSCYGTHVLRLLELRDRAITTLLQRSKEPFKNIPRLMRPAQFDSKFGRIHFMLDEEKHVIKADPFTIHANLRYHTAVLNSPYGTFWKVDRPFFLAGDGRELTADAYAR